MNEHPLTPYASAEMLDVWGERWGVMWERKLWLAVAAEQRAAGVFDHIERLDHKMACYEAKLHDVRLWEIKEIELRTRHDLKARLEAFNKVASEEYGETLELLHWGMTSADVVDNLALARMRRSFQILGQVGYADQVAFRGIKGAVGTQQDQIDLLGSILTVELFDRLVATRMGFGKLMNSVGQVYPRSLDTAYAALAMSKLTAQPWRTIANGYLAMITAYSGDQWNEGDVSTSVVRRVALPGVFLACDAARMAAERGT